MLRQTLMLNKRNYCPMIYFTAYNGSVSNAGTELLPFKTKKKALEVMTKKDLLIIKDMMWTLEDL